MSVSVTFTASDLQARDKALRSEKLSRNRPLESTLLPDVEDNFKLVEVIDWLREATAPKGASKNRRSPSLETPALTLRFYAKKAEDFIGDETELDEARVAQSARVFEFVGRVTVTRYMQGGRRQYCVTDGHRSLTVGERKKEDKTYAFELVRTGGFAQPTGRVAGYRSPGRTPIFDSDR